MRKLNFTEEEFLEAIRSSKSKKEAFMKLGYKAVHEGTTFMYLFHKLNPDISHFKVRKIDDISIKYVQDNYLNLPLSKISSHLKRNPQTIIDIANSLGLYKRPNNKVFSFRFTEEEFLEAIKTSYNHGEAARKLGYSGNGRSAISGDTLYGRYFDKLQPNTDHFSLKSRSGSNKHIDATDELIIERYYNKYKQSCESTARTMNYRKDIKFDLSLSEFEYLVKLKCNYCGKTNNTTKIRNRIYNLSGIDRIDSNKNYTIDNCVPCCKICNRMKMDSSKEDFISNCIKVINHQSSLQPSDTNQQTPVVDNPTSFH